MIGFERYFSEVLAGAGKARRPRYIQVMFRNGERPDPHDSHRNVDRWCEEHSGSYPVRGWMVDAVVDGRSLFSSHSLICNSHGQVYDITRLRPGPFVEHLGDPDDYEALRRAHPQVVWPPPPAPRASDADA